MTLIYFDRAYVYIIKFTRKKSYSSFQRSIANDPNELNLHNNLSMFLRN